MPKRKIRVSVITRKGRNLILRWKVEGKVKEQTTQHANDSKGKRAAERDALQLELDLASCVAGGLSWWDFDKRYTVEHLSALSEGSQSKWQTVESIFREEIGPDTVNDVDSATLSRFANILRKSGVKEVTVAGYLRQLLAGLNWGYRMGILEDRPRYTATRRTKGFSSGVRHRAVTEDEFGRILKASDSPLFLQSMFYGSLRLSEALKLTWHDSGFCVDFSRKHPMYKILAEDEKGHRDRLLPIAPEFSALLLEKRKETGLVGDVLARRTMQHRVQEWATEAKVFDADGKPVSSQSFRRAFGTRWASRLMPAQLQQLMRHQNITTTMTYYVRLNADELAETLYEKAGE